MLVDTHCHVNMIVKNTFDTALTQNDLQSAKNIIFEAEKNDITKILNVGTSLIESLNSLELAKNFNNIYASIGIHPNDLTDSWKQELKELEKFLLNKEKNKILAIGETGIDLHYPDYNLQRQKDAFKTQIELALKNDLALVVHTRDGAEETLRCLEEFKDSNLRGTIHCFSEGLDFAAQAINWGFVLGITGTVTYPKNNILREVVKTYGLDNIILETDAPFLPPQIIRGKQNQPLYIKIIAEYIAELLNTSFEEVAKKTTENAYKVFKFNSIK